MQLLQLAVAFAAGLRTRHRARRHQAVEQLSDTPHLRQLQEGIIQLQLQLNSSLAQRPLQRVLHRLQTR
jgi:hypothetical protein